LDVVADDVSFMSSKYRKWFEKVLNGIKDIKVVFKNGFKILKENNPICPVCGSVNVVENGTRFRKLRFNTGEELIKQQKYYCKENHGNGETQFFEADISDIVPKNSNYTQEFIETVKMHNAPVHAPLRVTSEFLNKDGLNNVSHQTISNIIFNCEDPIEIRTDYSNKYVFDVLWTKAKGGWNSYYFCLMDAVTEKVVYHHIYEKENLKNLDDFFKILDQIIPEERYISVDLAPKYKEILKKYNFKRQLCLHHAPKAIKNNLKNIIKAYEKQNKKISKKDRKKIKKQEEEIIEMILSEDKTIANQLLKEMTDKMNDLHPCIQQLLNKMIIPNFDDFFLHLKVPDLPKTTNKIELFFQKVLPKHVKRRMRIIEGSKKRIYLKLTYIMKKIKNKLSKRKNNKFKNH